MEYMVAMMDRQIEGSISENEKLMQIRDDLIESLDDAIHVMECLQSDLDNMISYAGGTGGFGEYEKAIAKAKDALIRAQG